MNHKTTKIPNNIRKIREEKLLSIPEISRKTGLMPSSVKRVEEGCPCRMKTKRLILEALGLGMEDQKKVFPEG
jgi:predicted transcriptional regulator